MAALSKYSINNDSYIFLHKIYYTYKLENTLLPLFNDKNAF